MDSRIFKLKEKAIELSKDKKELKEQEQVNESDLLLSDELSRVSLKDSDVKNELYNAITAIAEEQIKINELSEENRAAIKETTGEADEYMGGLQDTLYKLEKIGDLTDSLDIKREIEDTKSTISDLEDVYRILETEPNFEINKSEVSIGDLAIPEALQVDINEKSISDFLKKKKDIIVKRAANSEIYGRLIGERFILTTGEWKYTIVDAGIWDIHIKNGFGDRVGTIVNDRVLNKYGKWVGTFVGDRYLNTYGKWIYYIEY